MNRFFCRDERIAVRPEDVLINDKGDFLCYDCGGPVDVLLDDGPIERKWESDISKWLAYLLGHWRGRMNHDEGIAGVMWDELDKLKLALYPHLSRAKRYGHDVADLYREEANDEVARE